MAGGNETHAWLVVSTAWRDSIQSAYTELLTELIQWDFECCCIREMSLCAEADIWRKNDPNVRRKERVPGGGL
jgi:hypothetical protein